jgi:chemotaxis regulatin CheY-phosphate phosphatase CheZ
MKFVQDDEIVELTTHHPPASDEVIAAHEAVRTTVRELMLMLNDLLGECPQKTHLLRQQLPQVMMTANQIIAVRGLRSEGDK